MAEDVAMNELDELDKKVVRALQGDFPLVAEPYKVLAEQVGISEELFLERVKALSEEKKIRKMGAVLRHREVGFSSNVLVAWEVDPARLDEVAKKMAESPSVSHCWEVGLTIAKKMAESPSVSHCYDRTRHRTGRIISTPWSTATAVKNAKPSSRALPRRPASKTVLCSIPNMNGRRFR
jgi:DNA-binding Lrp family transcriptional regulator